MTCTADQGEPSSPHPPSSSPPPPPMHPPSSSSSSPPMDPSSSSRLQPYSSYPSSPFQLESNNNQLFAEYQQALDAQALLSYFQSLSVLDSSVHHQHFPSPDNNRLNNRTSPLGGGYFWTRRETVAEPSQHFQRPSDLVNGSYGYGVRPYSDDQIRDVPSSSRNPFSGPRFWPGNDSLTRNNGGYAPAPAPAPAPASSIANDRNSCNLMQKWIAEGSRETIDSIFNDVILQVCELMVDPFGHHVVVKLMEKCNANQISHILALVTQHQLQFISICTDPLGTRSIQSLFKCLRSAAQIARIVDAISAVALILTKSNNASQVILQCFNQFSPLQNKGLLEVITRNCYQIAIDEHGCCMLQKCLAIGCDVLKQRLIHQIIANALKLCVNCYGNYVVQYVVEVNDRHVTSELMRQLSGNYAYLSRNKYGSHVVQKLLKLNDFDPRFIVCDLLRDIDSLLLDPFGNYVIQTALLVSKDNVRQVLMCHIRNNIQSMKFNTFGRKILEKLHL